jgi:hypothetical protein
VPLRLGAAQPSAHALPSGTLVGDLRVQPVVLIGVNYFCS